MTRGDVISNELLASLVTDSADAIIVVDESGSIVFANDAVRSVFGFEPAELVGRRYAMLVPQGDRTVHGEHHVRYMADPVARPMGRDLSLRGLHRDGYEIDLAISLVPMRSTPLLVAAFVREMAATKRLVARLGATNEILAASLASESQPDVEERVVRHACSIVDAEIAWLLVRGHDDPDLSIVAHCGEHADRRVVDALIEQGIAGLAEPAILSGADLSGLPGAVTELLVAPIRSHSLTGVLVAGRLSGTQRFTSNDRDAGRQFAGAVAITLELMTANAELAQLRLMMEHDRIARDLHDTVIQRLFAIAMRLESAVPGSTGVAAERMGEAVDALDEVIRDVRTTIFDLRRSARPQSGLRAAIATEIDGVAELLGFAPSLRFIGPIDAYVTEEVAEAVPSVVRELLSNVVRHADSTAVDVAVMNQADSMSIAVTDDGSGVDAAAGEGDGLSNLRARAEALGGSFTVCAVEPHGVRAEWVVPLVQ